MTREIPVTWFSGRFFRPVIHEIRVNGALTESPLTGSGRQLHWEGHRFRSKAGELGRGCALILKPKLNRSYETSRAGD
jgi:hypothetical protein